MQLDVENYYTYEKQSEFKWYADKIKTCPPLTAQLLHGGQSDLNERLRYRAHYTCAFSSFLFLSCFLASFRVGSNTAIFLEFLIGSSNG